MYGTVGGFVILFLSCTISSLKGIITKKLLSEGEPLSTFQLLNIVLASLLIHR